MDLRWYFDLDPFGAETQSAEEELEQDLVHVIEQDKGSNGDDPERGLGVANILSDQIPSNFQHDAEIQLAKDDRVAAVTVALDVNDVGGPKETTATFSATVQPADDVIQQLNLTVPMGTSTAPKA